MIGARVKGRVVRVDPTGVLLEGSPNGAATLKVLVLPEDLDWNPYTRPDSVVKVGDEVEALVIALHPEIRDCARGSVKALAPERDPWRDPSVYVKGAELRGTVAAVLDHGYSIVTDAGAVAVLRRDDTRGREFKLGEVATFLILDVHGAGRRLMLSVPRTAEGESTEAVTARREKGARRKRRSMTQIMEEQSRRILRERLPAEWVIHEYAPDYGIDLVVEVFRFIDQRQHYAETLGESFFAQLKAVKSADATVIRAHGRINVEKERLRRSPDKKYCDIPVVKFVLETDELLTVQAMGGGAPVVLFVVALDTGQVYFLGLNDYVDKVLTPEDPYWATKDHKTLYIPAQNVVRPDNPVSTNALRLYSMRAKLLYAFSKFIYQQAEIQYSGFDRDFILHFIGIILRLDVWSRSFGWDLLPWYQRRLQALEADLMLKAPGEVPELAHIILPLWDGLNALSRTHEEICREWFLPTLLAQMSSYPESPEVLTED